MVDLMIKNGLVLTMNKERLIIKDGCVAVEEGKIVDLGKTKEIEGKYKADEVINASEKIVAPGLINTHTHLSMTLFRGLIDDKKPKDWLPTVWKIESNLTREEVYCGALLGALELIKSGTTTFSDHYFFMEEVAKAVRESGLRACLAQALLELMGPDLGQNKLSYTVDFAKKFRGAAGGRVETFLGPHALYSVTEETLKKIREVADKENFRIHLHMAESKWEIEMVKEKYGKTTVEKLNEMGFLKPDVVGAHSIFVSENEIKILAEKRVNVAYCPTTPIKAGVGVAPIPEMLQEGVNVSLGTDGAGSNNTLDLFRELRMAAVIHKLRKLNPETLPAFQVLEMATVNGAKTLGMEKGIGSLEKGKKADVIIVDFKKPHVTPFHNIPSTLVYSTVGGDVDTVIVDGKVVMRERKVLTLKEEEIIDKANACFKELVEKAGMETKLM